MEFAPLQELCVALFTNFTPQQIFIGINKFFQLAQAYSDYLISVDKAIYGIKPIRTALLLLTENNEQISPLHREFAKLCLKAKCYMHSLRIIENPITSFRKSTSPMDIIVYNYYRGLLFIGLQRYQQAIDAFKLAISLPTQIIHKVHTECFKKLILVTLIHTGRLPALPSTTPQILKMRFENAMPSYKALGYAYIQKNDQEF